MAPLLQALALGLAFGWPAVARGARAGGGRPASGPAADRFSALEVPGGVLLGDVLAIVAVDGAGEEHRLTVHVGVLEAVEYFQAGERWRMLRGNAANRTEVRIELPPDCGRDGLLALLRRLYSRRPWPASAWAEVGPVAAQGAAVLADMWLLSDIAEEARPGAGGVMTIEAFNKSVTCTLQALRPPAALVRAISELWEHQVERGVEYLDVLIDARDRYYYRQTSIGYYAQASDVIDQLWCDVTCRGCRAYPDRLPAVMSGVDFAANTSCAQRVLGVARAARAAGDLSAEAYDAMILDLRFDRRGVVSSEVILEMQAEARAKLINSYLSVLDQLPAGYVQELVSAMKSIDLAAGAAKRAGGPSASTAAPPRERGASARAKSSVVGRWG